MIKVILGLSLGFAIGFICRWIGVPVPAPPVLPGALLVLAITIGFLIADKIAAHRKSTTKHLCGGPTGKPHSATDKDAI